MEKISTLNTRLKETYGRFEDGRANYKIVFVDDERELRLDKNTKTYVEQPKYMYKRNFYVLERLLAIPGNIELITKTSYEPIWFFQDKNEQPLPPDWDVCLIVIDALHKAAAGTIGVKYKDPDSIPEDAKQNELIRITKLQEELFGNETEVGDALKFKEGVSVPSNYGDN